MTRLLLLPLVLLLAACGSGEKPPADTPAPDSTVAALPALTTVATVVETQPRLTRLRALVERAGLGATLADTSRAFTLFAPSNAALDGADALPDDALRARLEAHLVPARIFSTDALGEMTVETAGGGEVTLVASDDGTLSVRAGGQTARVTTPDLDAENGVVHVVDTFLPAP